MRKNTLLKILNPIMMAAFVVVLASGLMFSSNPEVMLEIHKVGAIVLAACVLVHVALNWGWIKASYFRKKFKSEDTEAR